MSTWNHRFVVIRDRFLDGEEELIQLAEVFYDRDGKLSAYARPHLIFDDMEGVNNFVLRIMKAAQLPLLHEDDFPSDGDLTHYKVYTDPFEDNE